MNTIEKQNSNVLENREYRNQNPHTANENAVNKDIFEIDEVKTQNISNEFRNDYDDPLNPDQITNDEDDFLNTDYPEDEDDEDLEEESEKSLDLPEEDFHESEETIEDPDYDDEDDEEVIDNNY